MLWIIYNTAYRNRAYRVFTQVREPWYIDDQLVTHFDIWVTEYIYVRDKILSYCLSRL